MTAAEAQGAPRVRVSGDGHVAVVALARPERHNALDLELLDALATAADRLSQRREVRAVVLCGEGPSFCSGLDAGSVLAAAGGPAGLERWLRAPVPNRFQRAAHAWLALPVPVIAAIHGACFGGGLQIALAADLRIAAPDARLSVMEVRLGLIPDMSITRTLPRLVRSDVARELTYTGRELDGLEAQALGLVTRVAADPLGAAMQLAGEIAARSPDAVRAAKRLYELAWTGEAQRTLALEAELQLGLVGTPNQLEAASAWAQRREPRFRDGAR